MLKTLLRPAMIFIPLLLGFLIPQAHVLNKEPYCLVRYFLMLMLFISCLRIQIRDLRPRREHWIILILNLLMGVIPYFVLKSLFPQMPALADAAFFTGITPTATAAPVVVSFLNGRVGFALTGFAITSIGVSIALLFLLPVITGNFTMAFCSDVFSSLLLIMGIPFLTAFLLQKLYPPIRKLPEKCRDFTFSLWSVILFILAAIARQYFIEHPETPWSLIVTIALVSLLLCICNFTLGSWIARRKYKRESCQVMGQKNTSFSIYFALEFMGPLAALGPIIHTLWHNSWNAYQMYQMERRRAQKRRNKR